MTTEGFMKPVEWLTIALESIQEIYDEERVKDRENAEQLIDSYQYAIELLRESERNP